MDENIGKLLDNRYEILECIGIGGMAVVYKARCNLLNRLVAIKILKQDFAQDAEFRRRFHDESQAVAMLSHPNIVAVYDVSKSAALDYIVMELIDGITLKQYMQKKGDPLNWREALHFITQIMKALAHAHSRGIIHRDIKPHNIMVLRDGSVKVADFGIARLTSAAQVTLTQEALGSVHYISPEQARGSRIDARADIYSAGVVLYEMVTGRLPFEGDSPVSVAIQHINSIPLAPRELNAEIPEALEAIILKAMAPNADQRYASAEAMLADLEEFRKNPNINFEYTAADLLRDDGEPTQVRQYSGRHNLSASANASPEVRRSHPRRREVEYDDEDYDDYDESRRRSNGPLPIILAVGAVLVFLVAICYFLWTSFFRGLVAPPTAYVVPDLKGMTVEEIQADTELMGPFTIEIGKTIVSEEVPMGQVVHQSPEAKREVKEGNLVITVDVSGGKTFFELDDYVNRRALEIKLQLEGRGLVVALEEEYSTTVTKDFILSQQPKAGTKMEEGETVTLTVSKGPKVPAVTMISLEGMPLDYAKTKITEMNLIVGEQKEVFSDKQPVGNIVSQSTPPNTEVPEGSVVNLQVSKGPESAEPSPLPTPSTSPAPTPWQPAMRVEKQLTVELPSDKQSVRVVLTVDGETKYDTIVDTSVRTIYPRIEGLGIQEVGVYIDGALIETLSLDFS